MIGFVKISRYFPETSRPQGTGPDVIYRSEFDRPGEKIVRREDPTACSSLKTEGFACVGMAVQRTEGLGIERVGFKRLRIETAV
jgi:hypothetical protein